MTSTALIDTPTDRPVVTTGLSAGVTISAALVLFLGIQPRLLLDLAERAAGLVR